MSDACHPDQAESGFAYEITFFLFRGAQTQFGRTWGTKSYER